MTVKIITGDCRDVLRTIADESVHAIVTDPPYHLIANKREDPRKASPDAAQRSRRGFMGMHWDGGDIAFRPETWAECLRVLKPGGYLLAFGGTRTYHRLACAVEDAGFEIRDQIGWLFGSGFPKSRNGEWGGTALKPGNEPIVVAQKQRLKTQEWVTIESDINRIAWALWSLVPANFAELASKLNPLDWSGQQPFVSAPWNAEERLNIRGALSEVMGTSLFGLATVSSLSTVSSWKRVLTSAYIGESTSTTGTGSSTTTDWRTLRFFLSKITPENIILAHRSGAWSHADACIATRYLNATAATLSATQELSALGPVIDSLHIDSPVADASHELERIVLARKPLIGTVEANWREHGTGSLNIDGCRIGTYSTKRVKAGGANDFPHEDDSWTPRSVEVGSENGRWPANVCHDGSDEVLAAFPDAPGQIADASASASASARKTQNVYGAMKRGNGRDGEPSADSTNDGAVGFNKMRPGARREDAGSAARFFYCAKASREDRNIGCEDLDEKPLHWSSGDLSPGTFQSAGTKKAAKNNHPTVKPTELMRWLVRLVTPKGGTVLDPFAGSGSTGRAADIEGFDAILIEIDPQYADVARKRIHGDAPLFSQTEVVAHGHE